MKSMHAIGKIFFCCALSFLLASCETIKEIRQNDLINKAGSFQLNPVRPDTYWYNGKAYEYNQYEIRIISSPGRAHIKWDGKYIGDTPMKYRFTGTLDRADILKIVVIPFDQNLEAQEAALKIRTELPRKIFFDLHKK